MSTKTERLIIEFDRRGHPLGRIIKAEEVPELIEALRRRLGCTAEELDLSPESLKRLEARLIALHQAVEEGQVPMDDEETMRLMREVTAYLGQVMVVNLNGEWDEQPPGIWPGMVWIPRPIEVIKGETVNTSPRRGFVATHTAAYFWDIIGTGREKGFLWKQYNMMTEKRWRERL